MNIVVVENDSNLAIEYVNEMDRLGHTVYVISTPSDENPVYLSQLMEISGEVKIDFILSFGFFSNLSLAANVMKLKYASWLVDGYTMSLFSPALNQEWNFFFTPDHVMEKKLLDMGIKNVYFLPIPMITKEFDTGKAGIFYLQNDGEFDGDSWNSLSNNAKGYIDGQISIMRQETTYRSLYNSFSSKVKEEIDSKFGNDEKRRLSNAQDYFDICYLYDMLKVREYSFYKEICAFKNYSLTDNMAEAETVFAVPNKKSGSMVTEFELDAIASKKLLIASGRTDFSFLGDIYVPSYKDRFEFAEHASYYLSRPKEKEDCVEAIYHAMLAKNTVSLRLEEMLEVINS